ncbi:MAG: chromate resistance protein ChrB domain-containing protein [Vicinamibacteraceae bacterium]
MHQLPTSPSNLRVKTWRRMQQLGAIALKQAVYVLPDSPSAREDFEWLKTEVEGAGGEASVFAAASVDAWSDDGLTEEFRRDRQAAYTALAEELEAHIRRRVRPRRRQQTSTPPARALAAVRERLAALERIDFFGSAGRDRVVALLTRLEERPVTSATAPGAAPKDRRQYQGRLWVTRPRPGVDRMSSAWLIRRFIDPDARFGFVADNDAAPRDAVPFDMFGVEFTHRDDRCTFETLCLDFALDAQALRHVAAIVHDLDLKDARFNAPEAPAVGLLIDGLQLAHADDADLLSHGIVLFEALYRATERAVRPTGPRPLAKRAGANSK